MKVRFTFFIITMICCISLNCFAATKSQKRALLIGISDYGNPREDINKWTNLSGANDVVLLSAKLKKQGFHIAILSDKNATYANIIKALNSLVRCCKKGDLIYLHFSTHGQPFEDENGDELDGWDEAIIPYDAQKRYVNHVYTGEHHLIDDELGKYIDKLRNKIGVNGMLYVVIDACHAGTSSRGDESHIRGTNVGFSKSGKEYKPNRTNKENDYFHIKTLKGQSPVYILEACRSYQINREIKKNNTWYGGLSYSISKAIDIQKIDYNPSWIKLVKNVMQGEPKLRKQNMVIEYSK